MENVHLLIIVLFLILFIQILNPNPVSEKESEPEKSEPKKEGMMVKNFDYERGCKYGVCATQFVDNNIVNYGDSPMLNSDGF